MRSEPTVAEARLWTHRRGRRLDGCTFSRQIAIGPVHRRPRLSLDGSQHNAEVDARRQQWLDAQGFVVLRFWNIDVLQNIEGVLRVIYESMRRALTR